MPRDLPPRWNRKGHPRGECPALPSEAGLEADPRALVPVTASFVLAPTVFVSGPAPCVGIHLDAPFGLVVVLVLDVPAIAFPVAYDGSRGVRRREGENADRTRNGAHEIVFHDRLLPTFCHAGRTFCSDVGFSRAWTRNCLRLSFSGLGTPRNAYSLPVGRMPEGGRPHGQHNV